MIFAVHMPVWRRWPLLRVVLGHLSRVRAQLRPLGHTLFLSVAGSEGMALKKIVSPHGAYVEVPNVPLGAKVNAAFLGCRRFRPDALVGLGSDDLVGAAMFVRWAKLLAGGANYVGVLDLYQYCLRDRRLVYWPGYAGKRAGETVGTGRCMTRALAESIGWQPFPPKWNRGLDSGLEAKLRRLPAPPVRRSIREPGIRICAVKTGEGLNGVQDGPLIADPKAWLIGTFGRTTAEALSAIPVQKERET